MTKKLFLSAAVSMMTLASIAQVVPSTNRGGLILKGGVNLANVTIDKNGGIDEAKQLTTFHVGAVLDLPVSDGFSIQPGLLYTGKGSKTQQGQETNASYFKASSNPMYVELPLNFVGKIPLTNSSNFYFGAGPYAAVGVGGKNRTEGKVFGIAFNRETEINYTNDNPTTSQEEGAGYGRLKRFDYGFNVTTGIDMGKFLLGANYGYGLAKINSGTSSRADDLNKHRVLSFSVGVKL